MLALALAGLLLTIDTSSAPAAPAPVEALQIRLDRLSPAVLPRKGTVLVTGTVTNPTKDSWRELNVHLTTSPTAIATSEALATSYAEDDATLGLQRLQSPQAFTGIGDLKAGESRRFRIKVPRSALGLPDQPGTYWLGAHVLGTSPDGRDDVADARVRTLVTQVAKRAKSSRIALTIPVRAVVRTHADGRPLHDEAWAAAFGPGGRLERLVRLIESGHARQLTIVADPAVVDLADRLGTGLTEDESLATSASTWVERLRQASEGQTLLALGYADPDVASLSRLDPMLITAAADLGRGTMDRLQLASLPAVAPPMGVLPDRALGQLPTASRILLDGQKSEHPATTAADTADGHTLIFTASAPNTSALEVRQWLLAQAALRAGEGGTLVVSLPPRWDPGPDSPRRFFAGLRQPWLQLTDLPQPTGVWNAELPYPESAAKNEFGTPAVDAARNLISTSRRYNATVVQDAPDDRVGVALQTVSYQARRDRRKAIAQSIAVRRSLIDALAAIHVVGRPAVNLAGGSGTLLVTLVNELDQPVKVGLKAFSLSPGLTVTEGDPVQLRAHQRTTVRLRVSSDNIGVYRALISPVNDRGTRVGIPLEFSIRSSNVTRWVWALMGAGAAVLFGTIGMRLRKRGLHTRAEVEAHPELDPERAHHD